MNDIDRSEYSHLWCSLRNRTSDLWRSWINVSTLKRPFDILRSWWAKAEYVLWKIMDISAGSVGFWSPPKDLPFWDAPFPLLPANAVLRTCYQIVVAPSAPKLRRAYLLPSKYFWSLRPCILCMNLEEAVCNVNGSGPKFWCSLQFDYWVPSELIASTQVHKHDHARLWHSGIIVSRDATLVKARLQFCLKNIILEAHFPLH